ncbi:hypothetical protein [Sutterella sp.]|uniref:hypothetical protein n=1 Tax=Sutterella sp. TaxID=1981025 RepID=UPI0026DFF752|nr:hypothetical protein [Sutterella sp.]MDO5532587.1 hypothetical protein [Sutterella sp.]
MTKIRFHLNISAKDFPELQDDAKFQAACAAQWDNKDNVVHVGEFTLVSKKAITRIEEDEAGVTLTGLTSPDTDGPAIQTTGGPGGPRTMPDLLASVQRPLPGHDDYDDEDDDFDDDGEEEEPEEYEEPPQRWRIKDAELNAKLCALIPHFQHALERECDRLGKKIETECMVTLYLQEDDLEAAVPEISLRVDLIEHIGVTYDPAKWNVWPRCAPQEDGFYRVLIHLVWPTDEGYDENLVHGVGHYNTDEGWDIVGDDGERYRGDESRVNELRFRPFVGPEESDEVNE